MIRYCMMVRDGRELASYGEGAGFSEKALAFIVDNRTIDQKFFKADEHYVALMNKKVAGERYSFVSFAEGPQAKDFMFGMMEKICGHFEQGLDKENNAMTNELTLTMSKKCKEFIVTFSPLEIYSN
jgi:hypothetical protein